MRRATWEAINLPSLLAAGTLAGPWERCHECQRDVGLPELSWRLRDSVCVEYGGKRQLGETQEGTLQGRKAYSRAGDIKKRCGPVGSSFFRAQLYALSNRHTLGPHRPYPTHRRFCLTSKIFFKLEKLPFGKAPLPSQNPWLLLTL